jgi:glycosyltransferase involved in cell wall biosynthesis
MLKEGLPTGGAERQLALIVRHLPLRWERRVWLMGGGPFADEIAADGHRVDAFPRRARFDPRPALPLWRTLLEWRPDVVHSWDWMSTLAAAPLCRALGIPIVDGTIRNGIVRRKGSRGRRLSQRLSALVVANSRAGLAAWGVPPSKGRVVYNAFEPDRLAAVEQPDGPAVPWVDRGDSVEHDPVQAGRRPAGPTLTVVMTGRMVAHKDFSTFIAAARRLDHDRPGRFRFALLGDGPERPSLLAAASGLRERGVVNFVSPGVEVLPFVKAADVGVLMSNETLHREGCSNAIMEYMACGLPVVCSSGGGNPELVVDRQTGLLVPAGDVRALAEALAWIADNPGTARCLGDEGRRRVLECFSVSALVSSMERIYWEALA